MFFDCNVEDSCNKINLKQDDREFGADLTKIILNEPTVCLPINSKIFSSLNNTQVELFYIIKIIISLLLMRKILRKSLK